MDIDSLPGAPPGLLAALRQHQPEVVRLTDHAPRYHVRLSSAEGPLFAWYSGHPDDRAALQHELAVRAAVGTAGLLRCPTVVASGDDWRLERMIEPEPLAGAAFELVVAAWQELTRLDLPDRFFVRSPAGGAAQRTKNGVGRVVAKAERWGRLLVSPLPVKDVVRARRLAAATGLPSVTAHGDFHAAHVLPRDGAVWVIDWELSGRAPLGMDLMQLWASLPDADQRDDLMAAALDAVPAEHHAGLHTLRYVSLVRRISSKVAEFSRFGDRDMADARRLLALLPEARASA